MSSTMLFWCDFCGKSITSNDGTGYAMNKTLKTFSSDLGIDPDGNHICSDCINIMKGAIDYE